MIKTKLAILTLLAGCLNCRAPVEHISVADVCQKESGELVQVEGYLRQPFASENLVSGEAGPSEYTVLLVEKRNGTGGFLTAMAESANAGEPNRIVRLTHDQTRPEWHAFTDQGVEVNRLDLVRITGEVLKDQNGCVLKILKIEMP